MSLKPLQAQMPLGQFDVLDSIDLATSILGGEVVFFDKVVATSSTDKAASDVFDGYAPPNYRAVVNLATGGSEHGPLMLSDDGITGYGTLFGSVVGGTVGQVSTGGAVLGPHTATGSGKLTCWAAPGLYAISLDATDTTTGGLKTSNALAVPGVPVTYNASGKLTLAANKVGSAPNVGNFVEFVTNGSLVNTPNTLAGTFNPPDGALTTTAKVPTFAVIWFNPATA